MGLEYLHLNNVVHGDLRGVGHFLPHMAESALMTSFQDNILIGENGCPLLADFGLARYLRDISMPASTAPDTSYAWTAPELFDPHLVGRSRALLTEKTDIYSYGCVCWEVSVNCLVC